MNNDGFQEIILLRVKRCTEYGKERDILYPVCNNVLVFFNNATMNPCLWSVHVNMFMCNCFKIT